jgi:hypothetical protein
MKNNVFNELLEIQHLVNEEAIVKEICIIIYIT